MRRAWPAVLLAVLLLAAFLVRAVPPSTPAPLPPPVVGPPDAPGEREEDVGTKPEFPISEVSSATPEPKASPPPQDACLSSLRWLLNGQNADGSWGDGTTAMDGVSVSKPGITGLALLSKLGAGYSHLSKDTYDGLCMGDAVRNGLGWLIADQREDGMFRSSRGGLDHAVAALAICEAYALTGSDQFKDRAQAAIRALVSLQVQDGSWGDGPTTAWAIDTLYSAELSGLEFPRSAYDGLRGYYDRRAAPDARELLARVMMDKITQHPAVRSSAAALAASPPDASRPLHDLYVESRAMFQFDGPSGPSWKAWNEPFKKSILAREGPRGVWPGASRDETIVFTSLATLALEIYYRYANVFGAK